MPSCFVLNCQPYNKVLTGDRPSFFLPPTDETLFLKWKNALPKRNDEELSHTSKVCHRHFLNEEIIRFNEYKILKMGSVPSIFPTSTEGSEENLEDPLFVDVNARKEKEDNRPSRENFSASFHTLKLPSENWTAKHFSAIHNNRPVAKISCYETKLSVEGWPLVAKAALINFLDNSITYRVSDRLLNPAGYLPVHFNSQRELEGILQRFHRLSTCQGVRDENFCCSANQSYSSTFNQGVWRSITCSEIVDLKNTKALIQCDSCRALKRNVLHKRRNPEEDPYPSPNKVKLVPQEKQALIKAINRNYDHSQNRLKEFKKRIEDLTNVKLNPLQEGVLKGILLDFNK